MFSAKNQLFHFRQCVKYFLCYCYLLPLVFLGFLIFYKPYRIDENKWKSLLQQAIMNILGAYLVERRIVWGCSQFKWSDVLGVTRAFTGIILRILSGYCVDLRIVSSEVK